MITDDTNSGQNELNTQLDQQHNQSSQDDAGSSKQEHKANEIHEDRNNPPDFERERSPIENADLANSSLPADLSNSQTVKNKESSQNSDEEGKAHENQLSELRDIPVKVTAILGSTRIRVSDLAKLDLGQVVELDKKVGDQLDIYVNNRLVAHGEVVISDEQLGISLTEIIKNKD